MIGKNARINQAQADLERLRPEDGRLAVYVSKYVSQYERLQRLCGSNAPPGMDEAVCMRRAIIAVLHEDSRHLPDVMHSTTVEGLQRICAERDAVFRAKRGRVSSPSSPSARANSASASAAPAADRAGERVPIRTCIFCGSGEHLLLTECKLCLAFVDRVVAQPDEGLLAMRALCSMIRSRAPRDSPLSKLEYSEAKCIAPARCAHTRDVSTFQRRPPPPFPTLVRLPPGGSPPGDPGAPAKRLHARCPSIGLGRRRCRGACRRFRALRTFRARPNARPGCNPRSAFTAAALPPAAGLSPGNAPPAAAHGGPLPPAAPRRPDNVTPPRGAPTASAVRWAPASPPPPLVAPPVRARAAPAQTAAPRACWLTPAAPTPWSRTAVYCVTSVPPPARHGRRHRARSRAWCVPQTAFGRASPCPPCMYHTWHP
jgi:hypothetical protein